MKLLHTLLAIATLSGLSWLGMAGEGQATPTAIEHNSRITAEFEDDSDPIFLPGQNTPVRGQQYTLTVSEDDQVSFTVTPGLGSPNPVIFVRRPDGTSATVDDLTNTSAAETFSEVASRSGTYQITVYPYAGSPLGRYTLTVTHRNSAGQPVNVAANQADTILSQLQLASAECRPGVSYAQINGVTRCFVPTTRYPADRSPYTYNAESNDLTSSVPAPQRTPKQEFLAQNSGVREVPCGTSTVAEVQLNGERLLCTRDLDAGIYSWNQSTNDLTNITPVTTAPEPEAPRYSFSCEEMFNGYRLVIENDTEDTEGTLVSFSDTSSSTLSSRDRCNVVVGRLQNLARTHGDGFGELILATGQVSSAQIVCVLPTSGSSCSSSTQLYQVTSTTRGIENELPVSGRSLQDVMARLLR